MERRFGNTDGIKQFVRQMAQQEGRDRQRMVGFIHDLEAASSSGGAICQYEWSDGKTAETGFLVIKGGKVVKREPWITDYLSAQKPD